jgi:hypothetical protein
MVSEPVRPCDLGFAVAFVDINGFLFYIYSC